MDDSCPPPLTVSTSDFLINAGFNVFVNSVNSNYVSSGRLGFMLMWCFCTSRRGAAAKADSEFGRPRSSGSRPEEASDAQNLARDQHGDQVQIFTRVASLIG